MTYLKLRRKWLLLQAEQLTKWQLFSLKMTISTNLSEMYVIFCICSACNNIFFFSAWDKSRVKWDNSRNSVQKIRTSKLPAILKYKCKFEWQRQFPPCNLEFQGRLEKQGKPPKIFCDILSIKYLSKLYKTGLV